MKEGSIKKRCIKLTNFLNSIKDNLEIIHSTQFISFLSTYYFFLIFFFSYFYFLYYFYFIFLFLHLFLHLF